jgi:hypothetical protein
MASMAFQGGNKVIDGRNRGYPPESGEHPLPGKHELKNF